MESKNPFLTLVGPPGTGKTTDLARQVARAVEKYEPNEIAACSFTRAAAQELRGRDTAIPPNQIGTLHAFAYRRLGFPDLVETAAHVVEFNESNPAFRLSARRDSVDEPYLEPNSETPGDELMSRYQVLRSRRVPRAGWPRRILAFSEAWERFKAEAGGIDFTDMIELALADVATAPGDPRVLIVDEAQDLTRLEMDLAKKWAWSTDSAVFAGDPYQAIYEFKGGDPEALLDLIEMSRASRNLAQSYRVPRAVYTWAERWISLLRIYSPDQWIERPYEPRDAEGAVAATPARSTHPEPMVDEVERLLEDDDPVVDQNGNERGSTHMILATCGYMLDPLKAVLRKRGLPFYNPYRRSRGDWNPLTSSGTSSSERLLAFLRPSIPVDEGGRMWTATDLASWFPLVRSKGVLAHGAKTKVEALAEREAEKGVERSLDLAELDELFASGEHAARASFADLDWLDDVLLDSKRKVLEYPLTVYRRRGREALIGEPRIIIGTIHSVKGGQAEHVWLFPDLSRAGIEQWRRRAGRPAIVRQFYVGLTRARRTVRVARPSSTAAVELSLKP